MSDFDITGKLAGQPKIVWIIGGVGVAYAVVVYRQKKAGNTVTPDPTNDQVNADIYGYQTGSAGGTGLASLNPASVPGVIGITAPVAGKPVTPKPVTPKPVTPKPVTLKPVTPKPVTPKPVTPKPVTPKPVTPKPVTPKPVTPKPVTQKFTGPVKIKHDVTKK